MLPYNKSQNLVKINFKCTYYLDHDFRFRLARNKAHQTRRVRHIPHRIPLVPLLDLVDLVLINKLYIKNEYLINLIGPLFPKCINDEILKGCCQKT